MPCYADVYDLALQYAGRKLLYSSGQFANGSIRKLPAAFPVRLNHS